MSLLFADVTATLLALRCGKAKKHRPSNRGEVLEPLVRGVAVRDQCRPFGLQCRQMWWLLDA